MLGRIEYYYAPNDFSRVIYHSRSAVADGRIAVLLQDTNLLLVRCGLAFEDVTDYQFFARRLSEQTIFENGKNGSIQMTTEGWIF